MSSALICVTALLVAGQADAPPAKQSNESAARVLQLARQYEFFADAALKAPLTLDARPLLTYSNPVRGDVYGNVFVWTRQGRPEVIGAIFDFRSESKLDSELHILSRRGIIGRREGTSFWMPEKPGVEFHPVPGAPKPAATPAARLRQMKQFVEQFRVERQHPEQGKEVVRPLTKPIYQYPQGTEVLDGAVFAFVEVTDPEAFLILEATAGDKPEWQFAFARMNIVPFKAFYKDSLVWSVDDISWDAVFDGQEPYAIIRENPRRGLKRTKSQ